jgi:hypothetical protein
MLAPECAVYTHHDHTLAHARVACVDVRRGSSNSDVSGRVFLSVA